MRSTRVRHWPQFSLTTLFIGLSVVALSLLPLQWYVAGWRALEWEPFTAERLALLCDAEVPVVVNFMSYSDIALVRHEAAALDVPVVRRLVSQYRIATLRADCTQPNKDAIAELQRVSSSMVVPVVALYHSGNRARPTIISGPLLIDSDEVIKALYKDVVKSSK